LGLRKRQEERRVLALAGTLFPAVTSVGYWHTDGHRHILITIICSVQISGTKSHYE